MPTHQRRKDRATSSNRNDKKKNRARAPTPLAAERSQQATTAQRISRIQSIQKHRRHASQTSSTRRRHRACGEGSYAKLTPPSNSSAAIRSLANLITHALIASRDTTRGVCSSATCESSSGSLELHQLFLFTRLAQHVDARSPGCRRWPSRSSVLLK